MIAFDTDVLTEILLGDAASVARAATCVAHGATLISRNRRDFERVPGLAIEFWE